MTETFDFHQGTLPVLISIPHAGTQLPPGMAERLTPAACKLPDTDWFVDQLYEFAAETGASTITARYSRYVVDLNRPVNDAPLYPGQAGTGLCPMALFDGGPLYAEGAEPDDDEIARRVGQYWQPYHDRLQAELARLRGRHDDVLLWDAHSIRSRVPRLFEGQLPDLNFGTAGGVSCSAGISDAVYAEAKCSRDFTLIMNGRFKGGYITRQYGDPVNGIHAMQLELAQSCYLDETRGPVFDNSKAAGLVNLLKTCIDQAMRKMVCPE